MGAAAMEVLLVTEAYDGTKCGGGALGVPFASSALASGKVSELRNVISMRM